MLKRIFGLTFIVGIFCGSYLTTFAQTSFTDIASIAGVTGDGGWYIGASFGDIDNDGDLDLFVASRFNAGSDQFDNIYRNKGGGTFEDFTTASGISSYGSSSGIFADVDNDGDLDLFITRYYVHDMLYKNDGSGRFTDVTSSSGISGSSDCAIFGDIDNDGDLDLYVTDRNRRTTNVLYENDGNGIFSDITSSAGVAGAGTESYAIFGDVDSDGYLDLYVLHLAADNILYRNNGDNTFTDVTDEAGVGESPVGNVGYENGVTFGDIDNDGDLDIYVTYGGYIPANNVLYLNDGEGTFTDITDNAGVRNPALNPGVIFGDFDHDSDLDLYMGGAGSYTGTGPSALYQNNGDNTFTEITAASGTLVNASAHGVIYGDIDNDGDLDIFVANHYGRSNYLFRNNLNDGNWLKVRLQGTISNTFGVGAKIKVWRSGDPHDSSHLMGFREIRSGSSYRSMNPLEAHFGLSSAFTYDIEVHWPSGIIQTRSDVYTNQTITIIEIRPPLQITIDIKPGSDPNSINCRNENGTIPVAVLTTDNFNATMVDLATVRFGKTGSEAKEMHTAKKTGEPKRHEADVDGDGDMDLVFHFRFRDTGLECSDNEAKLTGKTFDGQAIEGIDSINMVGASVKKSIAVEFEANIPEGYTLYQNYPNPFNPETKIRYAVSRAEEVILQIYNQVGQLVRTLVNEARPAGEYTAVWDGKDEHGNQVTSGLYFYQLRVGDYISVKKMIKLK